MAITRLCAAELKAAAGRPGLVWGELEGLRAWQDQ
jgi:hypothetical protein